MRPLLDFFRFVFIPYPARGSRNVLANTKPLHMPCFIIRKGIQMQTKS
uniref:Uncharacterized protein n=1 Tax=Anguilla anguilla TaxID=7936 RepID=A0A0E9U8S0_ANGAN